MASIVFRAAAAAALHATFALALPVEQLANASRNAADPQFHATNLESMNLTAVAAWSPTAEIGKRGGAGGLDPARVTGRLDVCKDGSCHGLCSASLVGPRHILTARHCVLPAGSSGVFRADYREGTYAASATIEHVYATVWDVKDNQCRTKHDFAIMVLDQRLGDGVGSFGVQIPDANHFNQPIFSTRGYPNTSDNGEDPYFQDGISIPSPGIFQKTAPNPIVMPLDISDNHAHPGQSGSAIWGEAQNIWGVASIALDPVNGAYTTGWASGDILPATLNQAMEEYP